MTPSNASIVFLSFQPSARFCTKCVIEDLTSEKPESYASLSRVKVCDVLGFKAAVETAYKEGGLGLVVLDYESDHSATKAARRMLAELTTASQQFSKPLPPIAIYSMEGEEQVDEFIEQVKKEKNIPSIENWSPVTPTGSYASGLVNRFLKFQKTNGAHL
ncbi:MAG TPA: hypothetical protein DCY07_03500 [Rhodospirillaceae bacterium]|nr:hypothetical protein [Rhodospirillaceae bacterium]